MKKIITRTDKETAKDKWIEKEKGRFVLELFYNPSTKEHVRMERWDPDVVVRGAIAEGGEEILAWEGGFKEDEGDYTSAGMHWVRNPASSAGKSFQRVAGASGCQLLIKEGHLPADTSSNKQ